MGLYPLSYRFVQSIKQAFLPHDLSGQYYNEQETNDDLTRHVKRFCSFATILLQYTQEEIFFSIFHKHFADDKPHFY